MKKPPKRAAPKTIAGQLQEMAEHLIKRVLEPDAGMPPTVAEETAAFKAVTSYYQLVDSKAPPETEGTAFSEWQDSLNEVEDGTTAVSGSRRVAGTANGAGSA